VAVGKLVGAEVLALPGVEVGKAVGAEDMTQLRQ
jgi:hypothetical protein